MEFVNKNVCRNIEMSLSTTEKPIKFDDNDVWPAGHAQAGSHRGAECSEIVIVSVAASLIKDSSGAAMRVPADTPVTIRGITNTADLSARAAAGTTSLYARAQYYTSMTPIAS